MFRFFSVGKFESCHNATGTRDVATVKRARTRKPSLLRVDEWFQFVPVPGLVPASWQRRFLQFESRGVINVIHSDGNSPCGESLSLPYLVSVEHRASGSWVSKLAWRVCNVRAPPRSGYALSPPHLDPTISHLHPWILLYRIRMSTLRQGLLSHVLLVRPLSFLLNLRCEKC